MEEDFVISKLGWHTQRLGNEGRERFFREYFFALTNFLQEKGLLIRKIVTEIEALADDDEIRRSDLTEEGWALMQKGYPKWGKKVDQGMDPSDTTILEHELDYIRQQNK